MMQHRLLVSMDEPDNRQFSDQDFIQTVEQLEPCGTREVAEHIGCVRETARLRLNDLEQQDVISKRQIALGDVWHTEE